MIFESHYWKRDLLKDADVISRWSRKKMTERSEVLLEKKIFISGYSIRKLIEAEKIGKDLPGWKMRVEIFDKKVDKQVDLLNWHRIEEFYDLEKSRNETRGIVFICNLIIHSFIFILEEGEDGFPAGFVITSDKEKEKRLYRLTIDAFVELLRLVGSSDIYDIMMKRSPLNSKVFRVKRKYEFDRVERKD